MGFLVRLFALCLIAAPLAAEEIAGARFDLPQGWTFVERGALSSYRKEFPGGSAALLLVAGPASESPARFDSSFESIVEATGAETARDPIVEERGTNTNGHLMRYEITCCLERQGASFDQTTVGIASGSQQMFFVLVSINLDREADEVADADFAAIIRSVRLPGDAQGLALTPAAGDGGLEGPYTYLATGVMPNVFGGMDFFAESRVRFFDPSGVFANVMPKGGSVAAHCAVTPTDCGTYAVQPGFLFLGGEIRLSQVRGAFGLVESEVLPFARNGDALKIGEDVLTPITPIGDGTRFDGVWRYFFASSGAAAGSSGGVAIERILTLRPDGTFAREGWSGVSSTIETGDVTSGVTASSARPLATGTYAVEGHTLVLTGAGEREVQGLFAPEPGSDALLVIDGESYIKQD